MTMWGAKRAINSTNGGHLAIMAKSTDWYTRLMVAGNPHSRPKTLMDLIRDRSECYEEVAGNPSTPMDVLVYMIEHPQLIKTNTVGTISTNAGWKEIALRKDLSEEVYEAFSNISIDMARGFAQDLSGFSPTGRQDRAYTSPNSRVSPHVLFILASMKNKGPAYDAAVAAGGSKFRDRPYSSVGYALAHYGSHLDEQTMLVLVQNAVLRTDWPPAIEAKLIESSTKLLPRNVLLALSESDHTEILDWLQKGSVRFFDVYGKVIQETALDRESVLTESEKAVIRERLTNRPEWVALETKRAEELKRQKIVDPSGKVVQKASGTLNDRTVNLGANPEGLPLLYIFWAREGSEYVRFYLPSEKRDCGLRPLEYLGTMRRTLDMDYCVKFYDMFFDEYLNPVLRAENRAKKELKEKKREEQFRKRTVNSVVFDSPVEEVFWEAYRKSSPSSLGGLVAQHVLGRFRLDFAIPEKKIGIELDGFEYHSSQDSIIKDRQRQREIEEQGWRIVRFAAKEVFDDPEGCVKQAALWVQSL